MTLQLMSFTRFMVDFVFEISPYLSRDCINISVEYLNDGVKSERSGDGKIKDKIIDKCIACDNKLLFRSFPYFKIRRFYKLKYPTPFILGDLVYTQRNNLDVLEEKYSKFPCMYDVNDVMYYSLMFVYRVPRGKTTVSVYNNRINDENLKNICEKSSKLLLSYLETISGIFIPKAKIPIDNIRYGYKRLKDPKLFRVTFHYREPGTVTRVEIVRAIMECGMNI